MGRGEACSAADAAVVGGAGVRRVDRRRFGAVAVALEDFFRRDLGAVAEEGRVVEDEGEVFWDLKVGFIMVSIRGDRIKWRVGDGTGLTSHILSLHSIKLCTASMARKLSSTGTLSFSPCNTFGVMTVARLWMSILLPLSSST